MTGRSVLARRPGSVAPGPAGLRGWIRLEHGSAADTSGPAQLIDSDGASLGAGWRRGPGDSTVVVGFDDLLRVELRLALSDSGVVGTASAFSDAALERHRPTGELREFRRRWRLTARRASCDSLPRAARV